MAKLTKPEPAIVKSALIEKVGTGLDASLKFHRIWSCVLEEMITLFRPVCDANDDTDLLHSSTLIAMAYVKALGDLTEEQLTVAWRGTMASHKQKRWPTIEEIRKHLPKQAAAPVVTITESPRQATAEEQQMFSDLGYESRRLIRDCDLPDLKRRHEDVLRHRSLKRTA